MSARGRSRRLGETDMRIGMKMMKSGDDDGVRNVSEVDPGVEIETETRTERR